MIVDDRDWAPCEVLREYQRGRRDFSGTTIGESAEADVALRDARLDDADFRGSFVIADFGGASLRRCSFHDANVKTCNFDRADLRNADFTGAAIDAATFRGAVLDRASFGGATCYSHAFAEGERPSGEE